MAGVGAPDADVVGQRPALRRGRADEADTLWALRTRCVHELCSAAYPPDVIAPWAASPAPAHYVVLRAGTYPHPSGVALASVRMQRPLP